MKLITLIVTRRVPPLARMVLTLLILGGFAALFILHFKIRYSYLYQNVEKMFPGARALPILGNGLEFLSLDSGGSYSRLQKMCDGYSRFTRIWLGSTCYVILYGAEDVEAVLSNNYQIRKAHVYQFLYDWIGTGLLTSQGEKWRTHRKIITPTFHFKILEQFIQIFNSNGSILTEKLSEHAGKGTFNVFKFINLYTLDNICETALGVQINAQKDSESEYAKAVKDIRDVITMRFFKVWLASDFILNLTQHGVKYKKALKTLHDTTNSVIKRRKKELQEMGPLSVEDNSDVEIYQKKRLAFLDLLILSGSMSDQDIREEVDTFMFEGHDTVTSGISFVLYALAHNQQVQEAAYKEQLSIFGNSDRDPNWQDLQDMKYLDMVLKETQRMYPSIPLYARAIDEDIQLSDGYFIPKGCHVTINVAKLHRDPKTWPDPDKFDPDNFLPDKARTRNPYAFVPFSAGPRNCIGQRFAMMEMRCCVSKILRTFKINPSRDKNTKANITSDLVLFSRNGINIEIENRK